jgi:hypothetical protein
VHKAVKRKLRQVAEGTIGFRKELRAGVESRSNDSHRFSTVRMADAIVVLDGARVAETGTHDELMARRGPYSELYGIQAAAYR